VNLGGEADTNGAIAGQLLGALHGASALPAGWTAAVAGEALLMDFADRLLAAALTRLASLAA
jgi:ADP-ribosylglycohydrolase